MGKFLNSLRGALIEEVPNEGRSNSAPCVYNAEVLRENELPEVNLSTVDTNTLINDVYIQNDKSDMTRSIFKVEELISSLPKEMATSTKRASVLAILSSFNLTATEVMEDGESRVAILDGAKEKIETDCMNTINSKETQIEEYKKSIEALSVEIASEREKMKNSDELITAETAKIKALIDFMGGETN